VLNRQKTAAGLPPRIVSNLILQYTPAFCKKRTNNRMPCWLRRLAWGLSQLNIWVALIRRLGAIGGNYLELKRVPMQKKYIVRLSDSERETYREVIGKLQGTTQKVRRAQIHLKADAEGPGWTDPQIA